MTPRDLVAQWKRRAKELHARADDIVEDAVAALLIEEAEACERHADELSAVLDAQEKAVLMLENEMREGASLWRDAYPNGGFGASAKVNFANWITKWADRLAALRGAQ